MSMIETLRDNPCVTVRKSGSPDPDGKCVVYLMQRAQRAFDNLALNLAVDVGNELRKPVVVFFAPVPFYPRANLRHFSFLAEGIAEMAEALARRAGLALEPAEHSDAGVPAEFGLTDRELEVLRLLAEGCTNRQIGDELFITPKTASVHVSNILGKLRANSRTEAAAIAHREGL